MKPLVLKMKAMEARVQELLNEVKSVRNLVEALETENAKIKTQLMLMCHGQQESDAAAAGAPGPDQVTGWENLVHLHRSGFHVCNIQFGQIRTGECLFCLAFMQREPGEGDGVE